MVIRALSFSFLLLTAAATACSTRVNPNACCVSSDDCAQAGLSSVKGCDQGLTCVNNQCIQETCATDGCMAAQPVCNLVTNGCEGCTDSSECANYPGQTACETSSGACVGCVNESDCSTGTPVCDAGTCRSCKANSECSSKVCAPDGSCVASAQIAYASPAATSSAACSQADPCSLVHAVGLGLANVVMAPGQYQLGATLSLTGQSSMTLFGAGVATTTITSSATAPVIYVAGADKALRDLAIVGGQTVNNSEAVGLRCGVDLTAASVHLLNVEIRQNKADGIDAHDCSMNGIGVSLRGNGGYGIRAASSALAIDQSTITANQGGIVVASDTNNATVTGSITNSFIVRNVGDALTLNEHGPDLNFDTVVDNGAICTNLSTGALGVRIDNSLLVRTGGTSCPITETGSIQLSSVTALDFLSPDVAPYDYHVGPNSMAVDQVAAGTNDHDVDDQPRPQGGLADVGADEAR